ncbi:hypothetical protein Dimus_007709, partial [Dionaea muscipula]
MDMGSHCREDLGLQIHPGVEFHDSGKGLTFVGVGSSHGPILDEADESHGPGFGLAPRGLHGIAQHLHGMHAGGLGVVHKDSAGLHGGPRSGHSETVEVHGPGTSFAAVLR